MVRLAMAQKGCDYTVISSLDDIAWITNLRGSDVTYNPVFLSYLVVGRQQAWLFTDPGRFDAETKDLISSDFEILDYEAVSPTLSAMLSRRFIKQSHSQTFSFCHFQKQHVQGAIHHRPNRQNETIGK
jgi:Xaa-Pro aminopeptidase